MKPDMKPIIEVYQQQVNDFYEGEVMKAVHKVYVNVDKDRLVKAITDARAFYEEGYTDAISALRRQENPIWISVKERLPEQTDPAQKVLFITKTGGVFIGCYYKASACDQFDGWYSMCVRVDNVTHWMPLPEVPEEVDDG